MMTDFLPTELSTAVADARTKGGKRRMRRTVRAGGQTFTVLRYWDTGFTLDDEDTPPTRGRVDLFEGDRHLCQALVVQSHSEGGERVFEMKYSTPVLEMAPTADFVRGDDETAGF